LPQDVVRIEPELQVVAVARLLHNIAIRGDARRLEGDMPDLALLLRDQVDMDREARPQVADVELADPDPGDAAHVTLLGIGLAADLPIHAIWLARHRRRALERGSDIYSLAGSVADREIIKSVALCR